MRANRGAGGRRARPHSLWQRPVNKPGFLSPSNDRRASAPRGTNRLPPFTRLHVHGYWNVNETKMSKSIGNVVRPGELVAEYGIDTLRYFTLREMSFGLDASFGREAIVARKNSDLANDLGNLFSRSTAMLLKYSFSSPLHN